MAELAKTDALSTLRARLADHARDPRAQMFGLASTLKALDAGFAQIEEQQALIARALTQVSMNLRRSAEGQGVYVDDLVQLELALLRIAGGNRG